MLHLKCLKIRIALSQTLKAWKVSLLHTDHTVISSLQHHNKLQTPAHHLSWTSFDSFLPFPIIYSPHPRKNGRSCTWIWRPGYGNRCVLAPLSSGSTSCQCTEFWRINRRLDGMRAFWVQLTLYRALTNFVSWLKRRVFSVKGEKVLHIDRNDHYGGYVF